MKKFYRFLDRHVFPYITGYVAHPISILLTIALFVPMVGWQKDVVLILLLNSYMNVGSFSASQITLREVKMTAGAQEKRDQETHDATFEALKEVHEIVSELHDHHIGGRQHNFHKFNHSLKQVQNNKKR